MYTLCERIDNISHEIQKTRTRRSVCTLPLNHEEIGKSCQQRNCVETGLRITQMSLAGKQKQRFRRRNDNGLTKHCI